VIIKNNFNSNGTKLYAIAKAVGSGLQFEWSFQNKYYYLHITKPQNFFVDYC